MAKCTKFLLLIVLIAAFTGCASTYKSEVSFPPASDFFITTGDGDIQKPYTPVGQVLYVKNGFRLPLPIIGLIPVGDVDPDYELRTNVFEQAKAMGSDGIINLQINWTPPSNGFLGFMANGGSVAIYGTAINR